MCADSIPLFLHNHEALLNELIKPGGRNKEETVLEVSRLGGAYPCYYKNSSVSKFQVIGGRVWCEMNITLTFTNFLGTNGLLYLKSEDMKSFITDGSQYILVDNHPQPHF